MNSSDTCIIYLKIQFYLWHTYNRDTNLVKLEHKRHLIIRDNSTLIEMAKKVRGSIILGG